MSAQATLATTQAAAVHDAYERYLNPEGGFLPPVVPLDTLPDGFGHFREACLELPHRYNAADAHVRPWLDGIFGTWDPELAHVIDAFSEMELHALMTVVSMLAHAYRWDSMPPRSEARQLARIDLPTGLREPWALAARKLDVPRVGGLFHLVLNNWRLPSHRAGSPFSSEEVAGDNLEMIYSWLLPPADGQLRALLKCVIESESRGAPALRTIITLIAAAAQKNAHETVYLLDKLQAHIQEIGHVFSIYIRKQLLTSDIFLTLIQPHFVWGFDEGTGPLDGASGSQTPIIQALDSVLGIKRESATGNAILKSREYLPAPHRRFLATLDEASSIVRAFVEECGEPQMTGLYNECVKGMQVWRRIHQKRGALYLKGETQGVATGYFSVRKVVPDDSDRVRVFEAAMEQHARETAEVLFPAEGLEPATLDTAFRYLTEDDRARLLAGRQPRTYAASETILREGSRRQGLFLVRAGTVRVVRSHLRDEVAVARLGEGELFGEMSFLENAGASASVIAEVPCEIDVIEREHIFELFSSAPGFAARFFQSLATFLSRRLREIDLFLPELLLREQSAPTRLHARRTGRLGGSPLPDEVRNELESFDATMRSVERALTVGTLGLDMAQARIDAACSALVELLRRYAGKGPASNAGVLDWIFRETFPWLMRSEVVDRIFNRPLGYALDYATLASIHRPEAGGDSLIGPPVDRWCRTLPTIRSLREAPGRIARMLRAAAPGWDGPGPMPVTGLGDGVGPWLLDLLATGDAVPLNLTCIGHDHAACTFATERAQALGVADRARFVQDNIVRLAQGRGRVALPPQQVMWADGPFSYLSDEDAVSVLDWVHTNLRTGGTAIVANFDSTGPDRPFVDHVLDWGVVRRNAEELNDLFTRSEFGADPVDIELDDAGVALYAVCTKR